MTLAPAGNFVFSFSDHAQKGFCNPLEWLPLISAFAVGVLLVLFVVRPTIVFLKLCASALAVRALVGLIGFALHADTIRRQPDTARILGDADHGDGARLENRSQGGDRRQRVAPRFRSHGLGGGVKRQLQGDGIAAVESRSNLEPGFVKHLQHRAVVRQRRRLEATEAVRRRGDRESFEQDRPEALP